MFSVFGLFKTSSMKYLSPLGVCFTLASNTEQSAAMIGGYTMYNMHCHNCNFGLTRRTWTLAWNLLSHDIRWVVHVRLCPSHHRVVWIVFAVWCFARRPVRPFGVSSCDCNLWWKRMDIITFTLTLTTGHISWSQGLIGGKTRTGLVRMERSARALLK